MLNLILIHAAHPHLMGDLRLLQQTAPSWRRGCQQQHNKQATSFSLMLVTATLGMKREENER